MSQFLRPDGTVTSTNIAVGNHTSIDEASPNDADFVRTISLRRNGPSAIFECSLSKPAGPPVAGISTFRWRGYESKDGSYCRASIYEGATLIDEKAQDLPSIGIQTFAFNPDLSAVQDWSNLRARFEFWIPFDDDDIQSRLYWAELEIPDPIASGAIIMF